MSEIMSPDYINRLPLELFRLLFDYMKWEDCREMAKVCSRWSEIQQRYPPKSIVHGGYYGSLQPQDLGQGYLKVLRMCSDVAIDKIHFETTPVDKARLERYLADKELMDHWRVIMFYGWNYSFEGEELCLPNVEVIGIGSSGSWFDTRSQTPDQFVTPCRIVAPKLRTFCQANDAILEPLNQLSEQIVELETKFREKSALLSTFENLPFTKLCRLTLEINRDGNCLHEDDFTANFKSLLGRLNRLKIGDQERNFSPVFGIIFEETKNLQILEIYKGELNANASRGINELKQLKKLTLDGVRINGEDAQMALSLPCLRKLKISRINGVVQLSNVPSLIVLHIDVENGLEEYLRQVAPQLQRLEVYGGDLNNNCFEILCTFDNLSSLTCSMVRMQMLNVEELFKRLKNLRHASFICCTFMKMVMVVCSENRTCDCILCNDGPSYGTHTFTEKLQSERYKSCFEMLRLRHVDCTIAHNGCKMRVQFLRNFNKANLFHLECI